MRAPRVAAFVLALAVTSCFAPDDEAVIRETFAIPKEAVRREMEVWPKTSGWFGREGLGIRATFELSEPAAKEFLARVAVTPVWRPAPPSRDFLAKIGGVGRSLESTRRSYEAMGKPLPEPGTIYNPTAEQLVERTRRALPLDGGAGALFACKTAGDDIMRKKKVDCADFPGEQNDRMFAVFDPDARLLRVAVHTSY